VRAPKTPVGLAGRVGDAFPGRTVEGWMRITATLFFFESYMAASTALSWTHSCRKGYCPQEYTAAISFLSLNKSDKSFLIFSSLK
jgi:hypothetical protein